MSIESCGLETDLTNLWEKEEEEKTSDLSRLFHQTLLAANSEYEGSVSVGGTVKWGDNKGVEYSGWVKGSIQDQKGNEANIKATQKNDGTGNAEFEARKNFSNKKEGGGG